MATANTLLHALAAVEDDCRTTAQLAAATDLPCRSVVRFCDVLRRRGLAERVRPGCYRLTDAGFQFVNDGGCVRPGPCRPLTGKRNASMRSLRAKLWAALRALEKGTVNDLLELAQTGTEKNATNNAQRYIAALRHAGYVRRLMQLEPGTAPTSNGFPRYLLVKNTGPKAPVVDNKKKIVRDQNTGKIFQLPGAA